MKKVIRASVIKASRHTLDEAQKYGFNSVEEFEDELNSRQREDEPVELANGYSYWIEYSDDPMNEYAGIDIVTYVVESPSGEIFQHMVTSEDRGGSSFSERFSYMIDSLENCSNESECRRIVEETM